MLILDKIFHNKLCLHRHRIAPLLKERVEYLQKKRDIGLCRSKLAVIAEGLYVGVKKFSLIEGVKRNITMTEFRETLSSLTTSKLSISPIDWSTAHSKRNLMVILFEWFEYMGLFAPMYSDSELIINRLFSRRHSRIRYLIYPLLLERCNFLLKLERSGTPVIVLKQVASSQLHAIDLFCINKGSKITEGQLYTTFRRKWSLAIDDIESLDKNCHHDLNLIRHIRDWLIYMGCYVKTIVRYPLQEKVQEYIDWLIRAKGLSSKTLLIRHCRLRNFMKIVNPPSLKAITVNDIDKYISKKRNEDKCNRISIASIVSDLRGFFSYCEQKGWCSPILRMSLKAPRIYRYEGIPSYVSWDIVRKMITDKSNESDTRDYAIMLMLSVYGLRCCEITNIRLSDIDWENELLYLKRAKGGKRQKIPLVQSVGDAIIEYIKRERFNAGKNEYLFLSKKAPHTKLTSSALYPMVKKSLKAQGVKLKHYGPHSLRHSCATHLINTGFSIKEIADYLGHSSLEATCIYAKVDLESLRIVADMNWEGLI